MLLMMAGLAGFGSLLRTASAQGKAAGTGELRVAAASDLQPVMPILADLYQKKTGTKLLVSYGSSGTLTTQILNGAPFDIFFGADFVFPEKLVGEGVADMPAPTAYARGTLVLWARKDSPMQPLNLEKISDPRIGKIAIADRDHAPYGRAAMDALARLKMLEAVRSHLVVAENVAQAGQFAESGNAQAGLISLTLASSQHFRDVGTYVIVPAAVYQQIQQCAVVMKASSKRTEAHDFLNWVLSPEIQGNLHNVGLQPVR